ncbi:MAG: hypothetical protein WA982_04535 [Rubrobacteraceae bacterium]
MGGKTILPVTEIGTRVKVREDSGTHPELRRQPGTIQASYGQPGYMALDVLLENGRSELFWQYQLEIAEESPFKDPVE